MKKITAIILSFLLIFSLCSCIGESKKLSPTPADANEYLTTFFSSYTRMNDYLKNSEIAISAFALDGAGLSSLLRAVYQAKSITFAFAEPVKVSDNVFSATVTVAAYDIQPLYEMYAIDRMLAGDSLPRDFVAQSFYDNIQAGTTNKVTTTVNITVRYDSALSSWSVDPSNDLAFAIFPNIDKAG